MSKHPRPASRAEWFLARVFGGRVKGLPYPAKVYTWVGVWYYTTRSGARVKW